MEKWIIEILKRVFKSISPQLRAALKTMLEDLEAKAKETANPWDDIFVWFVKKVLFLEDEE